MTAIETQQKINMGRKFGEIFGNTIKVSNPLLREFLAELVGTFCLMGMGLGSNAMYVLTPRLNTYISVQLGWGLSVAMAVWTCLGVSGGHINPAVTLSMAVVGRLRWIKVPVYWLAQYLGAFIGSVCVYMVYYDALNHFDGGYRTVVGNNATAGIFVTFPQPYLSTLGGFVDEVYCTTMLMVFVMALVDRKNAAPSLNLLPFFVGLLIAAISMTLSMNTGCAMNPARDLSPRIFIAIAGWGAEVFTEYNYYSWVPVVGPYVGAVLGAWIYAAGIGLHHQHHQLAA